MATLTFDHFNLRILHLETDTDISVQEIYDASKDEEDFPHVSMTSPIICTATGKDPLGGGEFTGVTLKLENGWKMKSLTSPGSPTVIKISGGNIITSDSSPFFEAVANIHYDRAFSTAPAAISLGSVLTTLTSVQADLNILKKFQQNRRKLDNVANTLTIYDNDGITPYHIFDIKDFAGSGSVTEQAEADPQ